MENTKENYKNLLVTIAKNLKATRMRRNLRQADMILFGFSERYVQKVESGQYSPNLFTLHRFAEAYKVPIEDFFK